MKIVGIDNVGADELHFELQRGARFAYFQYCISLLIVTLKRPSDVNFIRPGESTAGKSYVFT